MISLDSLTLSIPFDCLNYWQKDSFTEKIVNKGGEEVSRKYSIADSIRPGISSIEINPKLNQVLIPISAKILADDYLKGINLNTIEQTIDCINSTGIIDIKKEAIEKGSMNKLDTTQNIPWNETSFFDLATAVKLSCVNPKYENGITLYNSKTNKGLCFTGNQKTQKNRFIMYDKLTELTYKSKAFLESCKNPMRVLNSAKGIVRVEQNTTSFKMIRQRLQVKDNSINSILSSAANPNFTKFDEITSIHSVEQLELFERYRNNEMSIGAIVRMEGMRNIIQKCGGKSDIVKAFLKRISPKYWDSYWYDRNGTPGFQTTLQRMRFERSGTERIYFESFNQFKELLKSA